MRGDPREAPDVAAGWRERAARVIPGGSSTGSKRPEALYGTCAADGALPTHFAHASGCRLIAPDGRVFIDFGMALGAVGIGYGDPAITAAVSEAAADGNVTTLPHRLEVEVAERLVEVIPCAEQVRFLRTGAEATAAAVRIARAHTGRERLVACGYFGWLDWASEAAGVPASARQAVTWVPYDDCVALEAAVVNGEPPAAIIIEPLVHTIASAPWLETARRVADQTGAALIFDEVKTAFRVRTGGVQAYHGITPDLATLGKALANGYPLAAVVGKARVMQAATRTWISSTAAAESTGLAAAMTVLDRHGREDVCAAMAHAGERLREVVGNALADAPRIGVQVAGPGVMWELIADEPARLDALVAAAAQHGLLLKRGAYQFGAVAHDAATIDEVARIMPRVTRALTS